MRGAGWIRILTAGLGAAMLFPSVPGATVAVRRPASVAPAKVWRSSGVRDSTDAVNHVRFLLHTRYRDGGLSLYRQLVTQGRNALDLYCDGGGDFICHGGDPDAGFCDVNSQCHLPEGHLVDVLKRSAREYPESEFLTGQAVYALVKFARNVEAKQVADACRAARWWCDALKGYVLDSDGHTREAEPYLRAAMAAAPDSIRCAYTDATWLVGEWDERNTSLTPPDEYRTTKDWTCKQRESASKILWWWANPLYSVPGNERWAEHVVRSMSAHFAAEIRASSPPQPTPRDYDAYLWAQRVRRGPWDSWRHLRSLRGYGIGTVVWTSVPKARYHFVPDVDIDHLDQPVWRLDAGLKDEGYTPDEEPFVSVPVQLARFLTGDSMEVAGAATMAGSPIAGALDQVLRLVLSDGPQSFPADVSGDRTRRDKPVFLARVPPRGYVASVELITSKGVGWNRQMLDALPDTLPALSDLLLYDPDAPEPSTVKTAAGAMLGSTTLQKGARVGVFWETYGVPSGATLRFDLSLERPSGGLVAHLSRLFQGRSQEAPGRLTWSEPGTAGTDSRAVALDLRGIDSGDYTLVLRVSWPGQVPLERRRPLTVE
jgi:hypothetical protein